MHSRLVLFLCAMLTGLIGAFLVNAWMGYGSEEERLREIGVFVQTTRGKSFPTRAVLQTRIYADQDLFKPVIPEDVPGVPANEFCAFLVHIPEVKLYASKIVNIRKEVLTATRHIVHERYPLPYAVCDTVIEELPTTSKGVRKQIPRAPTAGVYRFTAPGLHPQAGDVLGLYLEGVGRDEVFLVQCK